MKRIVAAALAALLCCCLFPAGAFAREQAGPSVSAASAILVDARSGRVLFEKDADTKRMIASTTKLMTALVAAEACPDLSEVVTVKRAWTGVEGTSMYLKEGERLELQTLLYGMLLSSGNDAAVAVAEFCAGDTKTFVEWMNLRAESLGMDSTRFANPNGLNDENNHSTAADMAKLAVACMENETVSKIVATKSIALEGRSFTNHNKLLWQYEGCVGMKTGYTQMAGRTLVSCAERDGQRLIAVTLNDPNDWADHAALFDYGYENFPRLVLCTAEKAVRRVPLAGSLVPTVAVHTAEELYYPLAGEETVRAEFHLPAVAEAPITAGTIAGTLSFYVGEELIGQTYLLYSSSVRRDAIASNSFLRRMLEFFRRDGGSVLDLIAPGAAPGRSA